MSEEWQNKSFEKTIDFSLEAQKSLLLINGGSAVAILAIVSQHGQKYNLAIPLLVYGIGVIFSVLCLFLTRLAQDYFTDRKEKSGNFVNSLIHFFYCAYPLLLWLCLY